MRPLDTTRRRYTCRVVGTQIRKGPTRVLEVHVVAVQRVFQPVAHDFELHDLLPDGHVRLRDVELHFRVVDLIGQAVTHHLREVP